MYLQIIVTLRYCIRVCVLSMYNNILDTYIETVFSQQHEGSTIILQEVRQRCREEYELLQKPIIRRITYYLSCITDNCHM